MSENLSPNLSLNPIGRKLIQTKLVFTKKGIKLDSKPQKTKTITSMDSNKRLKTEDPLGDQCVQCIEPAPESPIESIPEVDPRLDGTALDDSDNEISVIFDSNDSDIPLERKLELMEDCSDNNPVVKALQTLDELNEECLSLGLVLNKEFSVGDVSDEEIQESSHDSKSGSFEVESIYDLKEDGLTYYLVKWKNWSEAYNTWEPMKNLMNCRKLVDEFRHIRRHCSERLEIYKNYYKLKGIIEDVVERKIPSDVMTTILLVFNDISLKDFNYTKHFIKKMRTDLRDTYLSNIDKISSIKNIEKRVEQITIQYNRLIDGLNITKRYETFDKFWDFFVKRKQLELRLNRWENEINAIIGRQNEGQTIRVENFVDCEVPPPSFEYISNCRTFDPDITISDEPPLYCQCDDCENQSTECCVVSNQSTINYTKNGILKDSRNNRNAIYECNKRCKCGPDCINRVVQKGRKHKLSIFRTDDGKGWGVRALEPIPKGSYVMEYVGEIISVDEADRRGHIYDAEGRTYLFDLDFTPDEIAKYTLDATQCGNVSHFVNHSCDPNLDTRVVWINNLDAFMPHIALFAVRNIRLNEELTFDYKINVHGITDIDKSQQNNQMDSTNNSDKSFDSGIDNSGSLNTDSKPIRVLCQCGAANCRTFLY